MILLVLIVLGVVGALLLGGMYNKLIALRNKSEEAWSSINIQLKRRYDLIPNLVNTVKGFASHEKETFERVIQARSAAMKVPRSNVEGQAVAEAQLRSGLQSIFALAENYPQLQSNTNFLQLQQMLGTVEEDIQLARRYYNAVVRDYNTSCETLPTALIANAFGFVSLLYFEIEDHEAENVKVQF